MSKSNSKIVEFFRKIGNAVMSLKNTPSKLKKVKPSTSKGEKKQIPSFLQNFMQKRHAGWPEYVMLKVQISIILLFVSSTAFTVLANYQWNLVFLLGSFLLSGYLVYLVLTDVKYAFKRDYPAYRGFIVMVLFIVFILVLGIRYLPSNFMDSLYMAILPTILIIGSALGAFAAFRVRYGRDFTYGTVKETKGSKANVKINYDIRSNVKNGIHLLETLTDVSSGDRVKIGVERSMLGLQGSKPTTILEKVNQ